MKWDNCKLDYAFAKGSTTDYDEGEVTEWREVTSGVSWGLFLGPILNNIFVSKVGKIQVCIQDETLEGIANMEGH